VAEFLYKGVNERGDSVSGAIDAVDRRVAVSELARQGYFASELSEKAGVGVAGGEDVFSFAWLRRFGSGRIGSKDVLAMTSQLSTALRAGLPMLNALEIIGAGQHKRGMKELLSSLARAVSSGESLSEAMAGHPEVFGNLYVSMVSVGETGGILEQTMTQLSLLLERDDKIRSNMKTASAYPLFVLVVGLVSVVIVITVILPQIIETIGGGVAVLPWPTRMLMGISDFLIKFGWLVGAVIAGGFYWFSKWKRRDDGLLKWDSFRLKIPVLGSVLRTIAVGRFARTLGALTKSGITILHALSVVRDTLGNELLGREIDRVAGKVKTGEPLAEPLGDSGLFPPLLVQIVSIGEQTGRLDEMLLNAADTFDEQADVAITRFMAIFPAVLILLLALVIGFIIAATLLPILVMELGGAGF
jgi:type II secretory pathway component PulF